MHNYQVSMLLTVLKTNTETNNTFKLKLH